MLELHIQSPSTILLGSTVPTTPEAFVGAYAGTIRALVTFVIAFIVIYLVGKWLLVPAGRRMLARQGFDETVRSLADSIMIATVWGLALAVALTLAGFGAFISALGIFAGAVALAVGFAARDLLGNFIAGVFILKDRPFVVGDWVEWNGMSGRIEDIDLRVTRVRTFDNEQITVPNGELANNPVTNPVAYDTLRQRLVFGIGYDDDIDEAIDAILAAASDHPDVLDDPRPDVRVTDLGDSDVGLQLRFWIADPSRADFVRVRSDLTQTVKEAFDDAGIDIPYPHRQLLGDVTIAGQVETPSAQATSDD